MEIKRAVADSFRLLSVCFCEPDKELFLRERLCENLAVLFSSCNCHNASVAAKGMGSALAASDDESLEVEYARLFIGPFELVAPPYGSVYLEKNKRLMGDSTMIVQRMYDGAGLTLQIKEVPDHIALELEFLHYLWHREIAALSRGEADVARQCAATSTEFFSNLFAPWVPIFCEKIRLGTDNAFYARLAECLADFIGAISSLKCQPELLSHEAKRHDCRVSV